MNKSVALFVSSIEYRVSRQNTGKISRGRPCVCPLGTDQVIIKGQTQGLPLRLIHYSLTTN